MIKYSDWRVENNADNLTADDCPNEIRKRVTVLHGRDKFNRPILNTIAGRHNQYNRDIDEMKKFIIYNIEQSQKLANPEDETIAIVFDLTSFTFQCMDYEVIKLLIGILQTHYPETLGQAFIVNAPFIFYACWAIIKPWLDPVTAAKVTFISSAQLSDHVEDALPEIGQPSTPLEIS